MQASLKGVRTERQASSSPLIRCLDDLQSSINPKLGQPRGSVRYLPSISSWRVCNDVGIECSFGQHGSFPCPASCKALQIASILFKIAFSWPPESNLWIVKLKMMAKSSRHPCNQLWIPADIGNSIPALIEFLVYPRSPSFHHASTGC